MSRPEWLEAVDREATPADDGWPVRAADLAAVGAALGIALALWYDYAVVPAGDAVAVGWDVTALDWLFLFSLVVFGRFVVLPLARRPTLVAETWADLRGDRLAAACTIYLVLFVAVGLVGPAVVSAGIDGDRSNNPPAFTTTTWTPEGDCLGAQSGEICQGTLRHPFGTTNLGKDVGALVLVGVREELKVAFVASMLLVPLGIGTGVVAGYRGGRVDDALMSYVDFQNAIPAVLVYIILMYVFTKSLSLFVLTFGALSWGSVARVVRGEVRQRREDAFVRAAKSAGASDWLVVRRHVLPNVTSAALPAWSRKLSALLVIEAGMAYLRLSAPLDFTWGRIIYVGTQRSFPGIWWISLFPTLALVVTVVAIAVVGDALRDAMDPQVSR